MKSLSFSFIMHAPYRLKRYRFFEIGQDHYYYDDMQTEEHVAWLVQESYLPLANTLKEMINISHGKFHCAIGVDGATLELLEQFTPEFIDVLRELAQTKCVEFLAVPFAYSLAAAYDSDEFIEQLKLTQARLKELFGVKATTVCNTCLLYSDEIGDILAANGYKLVLTEGTKHIMGWKSTNYLYTAATPKLKVLMRNAALSDQLAFHFGIDAPTFAKQVADTEGEVVNLCLGAETFGIRQQAGTGIFDFLKALPYYALEQRISFVTPAEAAKALTAKDAVIVPHAITWTGEAKDVAAYNGNDLQQEALQKLYAVAERVHLCRDKRLKRDWLFLQTVEHFRFMNHIDSGASHYESAYDAFTNYMNVLSDFLQLVEEQYPTTVDNEELNQLLTTIDNQEKEIARLEEELAKAQKKAEKTTVKKCKKA